MKLIVIAIVGISVLILASPSLALEVAGSASVSDGDTVIVAGQKIRLQGIDAPESDQSCLDAAGKPWSCGQAARDALVKHTEGQTWRCDGSTHDRYGRLLATCFVNGEDVDRWMVGQGWALSFVRYSHAYDGDESSARKAQSGLWAGAFVAPWDWRDGVCKTVLGAVSVPTDGKAKLCGQRDLPPNPDCTIKANMKPSHRDQCIYHKEGSHGYAKLRMDKPGRRWFCTEEEAQGAGCREALR